MMTQSKVHVYEKTIFFHDTDQAGVVHHANYLKYMEEARITFLADVGIKYDDLQEEHIGLAPVDIQIKYIHPLRLGDIASIQTSVILLKKASIVMKQEVFCKDQLCTTATIKLACLNEKKYKIVPLPEVLKNLFT
jgi:acyl-CoA thioester hydrolase